MNVLIYGLGVHGGGSAAVAYFAEAGHAVRVTDRKSATELRKSVGQLEKYHTITFHLGTPEPGIDDIIWADIIIKNPAIRPSHISSNLPFDDKISTDMAYCLPRLPMRKIGITGTKGKSTSVDALRYILGLHNPQDHSIGMAGNIGVPIFHFLAPEKNPTKSSETGTILSDVLILELSSWQLGDLACYSRCDSLFDLVMITSLFPDHMNTYPDYPSYVSDKLHLLSLVQDGGNIILPWKDIAPTSYMDRIPHDHTAIWYFSHESPLPTSVRGISMDENTIHLTRGDGSRLTYPRRELRQELLPTLVASHALLPEISFPLLIDELIAYPGLPFRNEIVGRSDGLLFVDDSAATVPQAVSFTLNHHMGFYTSIHLIAGGADKLLDTADMIQAIQLSDSLHLLAGSFTDRLISVLDHLGIPYSGPFITMQDAFTSAVTEARAHRGSCDPERDRDSLIILSPGCASFGLFLHEFDRGEAFNSCVRGFLSGL